MGKTQHKGNQSKNMYHISLTRLHKMNLFSIRVKWTKRRESIIMAVKYLCYCCRYFSLFCSEDWKIGYEARKQMKAKLILTVLLFITLRFLHIIHLLKTTFKKIYKTTKFFLLWEIVFKTPPWKGPVYASDINNLYSQRQKLS